MTAADRASTLPLRDRQRPSELDMQGALNLYASSAGKWAIGMSDSRSDLLDEATADEAKADELLDRAGKELDAGR